MTHQQRGCPWTLSQCWLCASLHRLHHIQERISWIWSGTCSTARCTQTSVTCLRDERQLLCRCRCRCCALWSRLVTAQAQAASEHTCKLWPAPYPMSQPVPTSWSIMFTVHNRPHQQGHSSLKQLTKTNLQQAQAITPSRSQVFGVDIVVAVVGDLQCSMQQRSSTVVHPQKPERVQYSHPYLVCSRPDGLLQHNHVLLSQIKLLWSFVSHALAASLLMAQSWYLLRPVHDATSL